MSLAGNDSHDKISQEDGRLALELGKIVSDRSVYRYRNLATPCWYVKSAKRSKFALLTFWETRVVKLGRKFYYINRFNGVKPTLPILGENFEHPWMLAVAKGAVENSQLETLRWLWQNGFEFNNIRRLYFWAGKSGDRDTISWVKEYSGVPWNEVQVCKGLVMVTKNYAKFRPVDLIQRILGPDLNRLGNWHSFLSVFESAARYGRKDVLKWGFQNNLKLCGCLLRASVCKVDEDARSVQGTVQLVLDTF